MAWGKTTGALIRVDERWSCATATSRSYKERINRETRGLRMPVPIAVGHMRTQGGFTRWAVLVVLVIIGLLALAVGPRLFGEMALTEIATAKAQVALLGKAVEQFHQDTGRYPTDEEGLGALITPPAADAKW